MPPLYFLYKIGLPSTFFITRWLPSNCLYNDKEVPPLHLLNQESRTETNFIKNVERRHIFIKKLKGRQIFIKKLEGGQLLIEKVEGKHFLLLEFEKDGSLLISL